MVLCHGCDHAQQNPGHCAQARAVRSPNTENMTTSGSPQRPGARSLTRVVIWTGAGLGGLALLCAITALAINPIANRAPTDDAPIVVADLMLLAFAALALMACVAVFAGLLLSTALVGLWHHWRPARGQQPEPPWPPPGSPAEKSGPDAAPNRDQQAGAVGSVHTGRQD